MINKIAIMIPGILLTFLISIIAYFFGIKFPIIGAAVFGIIIGICIKNLINIPEIFSSGINFSSKIILQFSIILLGGTLSLTEIFRTGISSFAVILFTIPIAFIIVFSVGRLLKVDTDLKNLIGAGTAICGGSAIAAISSIIDADEHDVAYSISTIFLFNVIAVLIFPPLGQLLGLSDYGFGLFAGSAINDTSSVVAAGFTYSNSAGDFATIVKLTRTTMIIPISIVYMFYVIFFKKLNSENKLNYNIKKIFPWFILGFLAMALINSTGIINQTLSLYIKGSAKFMIVMALSAIGLKTDLKRMLKTGVKPLLLGLIVWLGVAGTSLIVQYITRQL